MQILDVREIPPAVRHDQIFAVLDDLAAGDIVRLVNDHAPTPLRYQLEATRPGQFRWKTGEEGPTEWTVEITCTAHIVDARPTIASGGEPFDEIMAAAAKVEEQEVLVVYAPFEPVRLEGVLGDQGFTHVADAQEDGSWRITFSRT